MPLSEYNDEARYVSHADNMTFTREQRGPYQGKESRLVSQASCMKRMINEKETLMPFSLTKPSSRR